jgi:hypothetical protein
MFADEYERLPLKRWAMRRASPCGTVGRLSRGFNRAAITRVGDTSDAGAGRAFIARAGVHRAGETPTCGCVQTVIYTTVLYPNTEQGPIYNYQAPFTISNTSIPWDTFGTRTLTVTATIDVRSPTYPTHTVAISMLIDNPGGTINYAALSANTTNVYTTQQMFDSDTPPFTNLFATFANPGVGNPLTLFFTVNNTDLGFNHVIGFFKNVNISVSACV